MTLYRQQNGAMSTETFHVMQAVLRIVLALIFVGMGILHFRAAPQLTMAAMIPPRMRFRGIANPRNLVIGTGVCEIAGGLGLLYPPTTVSAGVALMVLPIREETRFAKPRLGSSVRMFDGAMWIRPPIQFKAIWVFINCEATMVTTRLLG